MTLAATEIDIEEIARRAVSGERLSGEAGTAIFGHSNLPEIGALATSVRLRLNPRLLATYAAGLTLSWREEGLEEGLEERIRALSAAGGTGITVAGGLPDDLRLDEMTDLLRGWKAASGDVEISALSPRDVGALAARDGITVPDALSALRSAGISSLGPWEFADADPEVLRAARALDLPSDVLLPLPPEESAGERVERLIRLRDLQDAAGGIATVIPMNVDRIGGDSGSAFDYLRAAAVARLMLDNVFHLRSAWDLHGLKIGQLALQYGADDFGTLRWSAEGGEGAGFSVPVGEWERLIREAGYTAGCRSLRYEARATPEPPIAAQPIAFG